MKWIKTNEYTRMRTHKLTAIALCMVLGSLLQVQPATAQNYTLAPAPFQTELDDSGNIVVNGCVWTYAAGTSTAIATYSNNAGALNSNPIITDYAGRFTVYLLAGTNYKFVYEAACSPPSHATAYRSQDNIAGLPSSASNADVIGTAGEAISAGMCAYLSDGSGSKTAGQWFKCDAANTYSSTLPEIGMTPATIASGSTGTIRLIGSVPGLSSLSVGSEYFVGTAGAITSTAPANARHVGHADTASSLILTGDPPLTAPNSDNAIDGFRLTLTTAVPVTSADVTAATTLFCTPYKGNRIALANSAGVATVLTSAEFSIAVPATTSTMYDVFAFNNSGTTTLELLAWTNVTTRATAVVLTTTGFYTKSGDLTRRYLGSVMTGTVSGQTEDSFAKRYVWNMYNRVPRIMRVKETTDSWPYSTNTYHQANGAAGNQLDFVIGIADVEVAGFIVANASSNNVTSQMWVAIGEDSTTTADVNCLVGSGIGFNIGIPAAIQQAQLRKYTAVGRHVWVWLEKANTGTITWYGDNAADGTQSGIHGVIQG